MRQVARYHHERVAAVDMLPMAGAIIRVDISELGMSAAFLATDAPGDLARAGTPEVLRRIAPEVFGSEESLLDRFAEFLTARRSTVIPLGFIESERLASAIESWCLLEENPTEWRPLVAFTPLGFGLHVRTAGVDEQILISDGRGSVRSAVFSVTRANKQSWLESANTLRCWSVGA